MIDILIMAGQVITYSYIGSCTLLGTYLLHGYLRGDVTYSLESKESS